MRGKITIRSVKALTAKDGKESTLRDVALSGFEVRARAGGAKVYAIRYRAGSGRMAPVKRFTIGKHGDPWTPDEARQQARKLLADVSRGQDPALAKAASKRSPTVAELARRFLDEHVAVKLKSSTAEEYRRLLARCVLPDIGNRPMHAVTRSDMARLHHDHRATPAEANQLLLICSAMFNFAERVGLRPDGSNPCRYVERFPTRRHERFLSAEELARLGTALSAYTGSIFASAAIKLLVFTGARLGEILGLQWHWIDFDRGEARLPDSKTGAKTLHLPPPALAVLAELPRIEGNPHVIVGAIHGKALGDLERPWRAIRKAAGLDNVRLHDLRHSFASAAVASGMGLPIVGAVLGHARAATTERYAHLASDPVKAAAAAVASKLAAAMASRDAAVAPLRRSQEAQ
jgi:integrase